MEKIRIAHLSDFHLGSEINERNELKEQINKSLIKSLYNIFNVMNSSKVDLVLIAGDFYESSSVDRNLKNIINEVFSKFKGKIIIAPGNHDYISLESVYNEKWPSNTFIFKNSNVEYFEFSDLKTRVYGCAFTQSHVYERKLSDIYDIDDSYINIGVFHGQIDSIENQYHPIFLSDIENSRLDYLALGHIHKRSEIKKIGKTYYAYSGNPMGRGFDELGKKGIYLGDLSKTRMGLNFYKIDNSEFHIERIKIHDFENHEQLSNQIKLFLKNKHGDLYKNNYYRIYIEGYIKKHQSINIEILEESISEIKYVEIFNNTMVYVDYDEISKEDNLKGRFVKNVIFENLSDDDKNKILDYGIRAFEDLL